jgi:hypothetical protein
MELKTKALFSTSEVAFYGTELCYVKFMYIAVTCSYCQKILRILTHAILMYT